MTSERVHLGIVEVGDLCALMRAANLDLFAELGAWVTSTPGGPAQRRYATACHRHAWHADLWAGRAPTIPIVDLGADDLAERRLPLAPDEVAYRRTLRAMLDELDTVAERVDPDLDPSTTRVLTLVRNDIVDLLRP